MAHVHQVERPKTADERQRAEERGRHDAQQPKGPTDARLAMEITGRFTHHPDLDAKRIEVSVEHGKASLLGSVPDAASQQLAETLARSVEGVADVRNDLQVTA
ncbi:MAG TPA: BON domain-containing protein [Pirellulales bacterium]|nr:BON domain-containing protein [Pirellulales bacterium]